MPGTIITFYSYKGGVGRSMLLANVAALLAMNGQRVLAVDWDMEAPGLHQYFRPFLTDPDMAHSEGVIDLVSDFAIRAVSSDRSGEVAAPDFDILRYASSLRFDFAAGGTLDFLPAGRLDRHYGPRVLSFDWAVFYERLGGGHFLEAVRRSMRESYDFTLIDSRTGLSDTSGICTVQMPDSVVMCCALNTQSIDGTVAAALSIRAQRPEMSILPVPSRIDNTERRMYLERMENMQARLGWLMEPFSGTSLYDLSVPYTPSYAYEEVLASLVAPPGDEFVSAVARLTFILTGGLEIKSTSISERERSRVRELFRDQAREKP